MYAVSQAYLNKLFGGGTIRRRISGLIDDTIAFTENDILSGSFHATCKAVASDDIKLGGVNVGGVSLTFTKAFAANIGRTTWKNRKLSISIGLKIADAHGQDPEQWEFVPLRPFYVSEAVHSLTGIDITAYDNMKKFDKPFRLTASSGTLYDFLTLVCQSCGVTLGMTEAQCQALPNGTETLGLYPNNDIETYRDMLYWLGVTACAFSDIDRQGRLVLKTWKTTADISINRFCRYDSGTWSDFSTYYTGLSVVNIEKETTSYYAVEQDDGLTMNIGSNPFVQYGSDEGLTRQRRAILTALQNFDYVPFNASGKIDPCFDLGDVINYTGGVAADSLCCIMAFDYSFRDVTLQGFGKDPALANTRSKEDKNLSGLLSKTSENEMVTHTFANASIITADEDVETPICSLRFATINPKVVKVFHEFDLDVTASGNDPVECEVRYYLNNELIAYKPVTSWDNDGMHLINTMYFLQSLEAGQRYDWDVAIVMKNGSAVIDRNDAHAFLEGQGLVAVDTWDGEITVNDPTFRLHMHGKTTFRYTDNVVSMVEYREPDDPDYDGQHTFVVVPEITDATFALHMHGKTTFRYTDNVNILTEQGVYIRTLENGDTRVTEDDKTRITEGG